jgi:hypothetical protein
MKAENVQTKAEMENSPKDVNLNQAFQTKKTANLLDGFSLI